MDQLPQVLQKEIWEYVRGDRAFWKSQYELVVDSLELILDYVENMSMANTTRVNMFMSRAKSEIPLCLSLGRKIRRFRQYLSTLAIPMYIDGDEDTSNVHWRHWYDWSMVDNVTR
jgi:hypothetical protein